MPEFKSTQGNCAYLFQLFQSMMYKYGPMLLYIYCPFVLVFGAGGIAWSHLIGILLISYWLLKFGLKNTGSFFISISALLVFLFPYQLWWNSLYMGHSDLIPTIFLTFGLISWLENRNKTSALFMGLSLCSKTIPGLFLCPLLLRKPKDSWPFFIIIIFTFGPYFLWDFIGMRNYFMFPTFRIGDSTSLVYTITPFFGSIVKVACIMGITFIFFKLWGKNWDPFLAVDFSIVSISLSILASQQIHNNYWVWLMPLITIACIQSIGRNWSKFAEVNA